MSIYLAQKAFHRACDVIGDNYRSPKAELLVLAIGGQESKYTSRQQIISKNGKLVAEGPATSWWQFERAGGVRGVIQHPANEADERRLCAAVGVPYEEKAVWEAMKHDDVLGAGFARLFLASDPKRLPEIGDVKGAWDYYLRIWRPGKPHPATWAKAYSDARKAVGV